MGFHPLTTPSYCESFAFAIGIVSNGLQERINQPGTCRPPFRESLKMYDFLDRPVTSLDHGGRFMVWSMRSWVKAMGDRQCPGSALGSAFARWNMIAGLQPFLRMMTQFNRNGLENFQFCALACNHVSEHEALILSLICSLRDSRPDALRDTLALLVEEDSIGDLIGALSALGRMMDEAAIFPARPVTASCQNPPL